MRVLRIRCTALHNIGIINSAVLSDYAAFLAAPIGEGYSPSRCFSEPVSQMYGPNLWHDRLKNNILTYTLKTLNKSNSSTVDKMFFISSVRRTDKLKYYSDGTTSRPSSFTEEDERLQNANVLSYQQSSVKCNLNNR